MVFPDKPNHNKFAFANLSPSQYKTYAKQYSKAKAGGIRYVYGWMSVTGVISVITDVSKGIVVDYGKRKFAIVFLNAGAYVLSPAVAIFTNASKLVKILKNLHSTAAFVFECVEDSTNLAFVPLDLILFGQPIPVGTLNRFNLFTNHTDFIDL